MDDIEYPLSAEPTDEDIECAQKAFLIRQGQERPEGMLCVNCHAPCPVRSTDEAARYSRPLAAGPAYSNADGYVVLDELGQPLHPEWYSDEFLRLVKQVDVPGVPLHGARHCAASLLRDLGFPDVVVAAWLGHTQVTVTHSHQHARNDRMKAAGEALGEALAS